MERELLLPSTGYLVLLLAAACVYAFRRRDTRLGRRRWLLLALVLWSYCLSTPAFANALINYLERPYTKVATPAAGEDPLIVVLSSGFPMRDDQGWSVRLDNAGWERTFAGIRLWKQTGGQLLFVGQPAPDLRSSAAEVMAGVASAAGVPASAIQIETRSVNTYQNLKFSREAIAAHGAKVWLVTSAMHMRRALAVGERLGLTLRPYPCDFRGEPIHHLGTFLPSAAGASMFSDAFHELFGLAWYRLRGRAD